jgi:uncharacterized protein with von Willebrand factor type A (vWA) domain
LSQGSITEKKEIVFVVDISGSMIGDPIQSTRDAMEIALKNLLEISKERGREIYFNVIPFQSTFNPLFDDGSKLVNEENINKALTFVQMYLIARGGTEMLAPLEWLYHHGIFKEEEVGQSNSQGDIIILTDGAVSNEGKYCI